MAQELGKIERPTAASYEGTRKLFLVPLVFSPPDPPADYVGMLERYWAGARNQLRRLADRTGRVQHVYHEGITQEGDAGLNLIKQIGPRGYVLINEFVQEDQAKVEALEDPDTFYEAIDWQRCLMAGLMSRKVMDLAMTGYRESTKKRFDDMTARIDATLQAGENGLLLMPEENRLQFPKDIQVFYVAPPALDDIHRWLRDQEARERRPPAEEQAPPAPEPDAAENPPPTEPGAEETPPVTDPAAE
jgi:hypothetical protein